MSVSSQPEIDLVITPVAGVEGKKFMDAEGVTVEQGGLRVSVQAGGCSGFKYSLVIEDQVAEDDVVLPNDGFKVFVEPFSAQYLNGVPIDYVSSMQGSGFTFKNPNATGGCGCGSSFSAERSHATVGHWRPNRRHRSEGPRAHSRPRAFSRHRLGLLCEDTVDRRW